MSHRKRREYVITEMDEEGEWEIVEHVVTEYNEATGEWEVVDDDDDECFDAETEAMLKRLEERKSDDADHQARESSDPSEQPR